MIRLTVALAIKWLLYDEKVDKNSAAELKCTRHRFVDAVNRLERIATNELTHLTYNAQMHIEYKQLPLGTSMYYIWMSNGGYIEDLRGITDMNENLLRIFSLIIHQPSKKW